MQLRLVEDLPYGAIAERLGCSEQTARAHVSRGLRRFEHVLASDNGGPRPTTTYPNPKEEPDERLCPRPR